MYCFNECFTSVAVGDQIMILGVAGIDRNRLPELRGICKLILKRKRGDATNEESPPRQTLLTESSSHYALSLLSLKTFSYS
ncbi:hypothetical protein D1AOALGA4SA_10515 [Olavius algarvensis Delta 1 endosymbiont]|nr:hypothetical protein D1AOALGA4SA_10515 [Olavius algarvensis Delta 1 endosymbiont]